MATGRSAPCFPLLGGLKIGQKDLVVITGASSGLGLACAETLAKTGRYYVVMAVRDVEKGKKGENRFCHVRYEQLYFSHFFTHTLI